MDRFQWQGRLRHSCSILLVGLVTACGGGGGSTTNGSGATGSSGADTTTLAAAGQSGQFTETLAPAGQSGQLTTAALAGPAPAEASTDYLIVQYQSTVNARLAPDTNTVQTRTAIIDARARTFGATAAHFRVMRNGAQVVKLSKALTESVLAQLVAALKAADASILRVSPSFRRVALGYPTRPYPYSNVATASDYGSQWNLQDPVGGINMPTAWTMDPKKGEGIVVAVVDSGIVRHQDLELNMLPGYDFITRATDAMDGDGRDASPLEPDAYGACGNRPVWHGTHVAGIIGSAGARQVNGQWEAGRLLGVAPGAKILPVRVLGSCGGYDDDIIDGLLWAIGEPQYDPGSPASPATPARVVNLSLGGPGSCSPEWQDALAKAAARKVVVVTAAGNSAMDSAYSTPQNCGNSLNVGASTVSGTFSRYSNFGSLIDVAAPGGENGGAITNYGSIENRGSTSPSEYSNDVPSLSVPQELGYPVTINSTTIFNGRRDMSGTSMAAPHVAGVAALLLSNKPALSAQEVEDIIKSTARPLNGCWAQDKGWGGCGAGILNAYDAVMRATLPARTERAVTMGANCGGPVSNPTRLYISDTGYDATTLNRACTYSIDFQQNWEDTIAASNVFTYTSADRHELLYMGDKFVFQQVGKTNRDLWMNVRMRNVRWNGTAWVAGSVVVYSYSNDETRNVMPDGITWLKPYPYQGSSEHWYNQVLYNRQNVVVSGADKFSCNVYYAGAAQKTLPGFSLEDEGHSCVIYSAATAPDDGLCNAQAVDILGKPVPLIPGCQYRFEYSEKLQRRDKYERTSVFFAPENATYLSYINGGISSWATGGMEDAYGDPAGNGWINNVWTKFSYSYKVRVENVRFDASRGKWLGTVRRYVYYHAIPYIDSAGNPHCDDNDQDCMGDPIPASLNINPFGDSGSVVWNNYLYSASTYNQWTTTDAVLGDANSIIACNVSRTGWNSQNLYKTDRVVSVVGEPEPRQVCLMSGGAYYNK